MNPDELRRTAARFRTLASEQKDVAAIAELQMLAAEYEAAAVRLENGGGAPLTVSLTLPN